MVISAPGQTPGQRGQGPGATLPHDCYALPHQPLRIGRDAENTLILNDARVSAYHAQITSDGQHFWIEDFGSTNGTYINGIRVQTRTQLLPECLIKMGTTIMRFTYLPTDDLDEAPH